MMILNGPLLQELIPSYIKHIQTFSLWQGGLFSKDLRPNSDLTNFCHLGMEFSGNHLWKMLWESLQRRNLKDKKGKLQIKLGPGTAGNSEIQAKKPPKG